MASKFPNAVDAFPSKATLTATLLSTATHSSVHDDLGSAIVAVEQLLVGAGPGQLANTALLGPASGAAGPPTFRAPVPLDRAPRTVGNAVPLVDFSLPSPYGAAWTIGPDISATWQAAIDAALVSGNPVKLNLQSLANATNVGTCYQMSSPVNCDASNLHIAGDSTSGCAIAGSGTGLVFGFNRYLPGNVRISDYNPNIFVNANSILDSSAQGHFGIRSNGVVDLSFQSSPLDLCCYGPTFSTAPNFWNGVSILTWDFCLKPNGAIAGFSTTQQPPVGGMIRQNTPVPHPFYMVWSGSGAPTFFFEYTTADGTTHEAKFTGPSGMTTAWVSFQINLTAGTAYAWVGSSSASAVQVTVTNSNGGVIGAVPSGTSFAPNVVGAPFNLLSVSPFNGTAFNSVFGTSAAQADQTLLGCKLSNVELYNNNGVGTAQTRADSKTINDNLQFFTSETSPSRTTIAYLPLTDSGTRGNYRFVQGISALTPFQTFWGLISGPSQAAYFQQNVTLENFTINCNDTIGAGIMIGSVLNVVCRKVDFVGGGQNVAGLKIWNNYVAAFYDCKFKGATDVAVHCTGEYLLVNPTWQTWSRACIRSYGGGPTVYGPGFAEIGAATSLDNVFSHYTDTSGIGGTYIGPIVDFEGTSPACYFYIEADGGLGGNITIIDFTSGSTGGVGQPHVVLVGNGGVSNVITFINSYQFLTNNLIVGGAAGSTSTAPGTSWTINAFPTNSVVVIGNALTQVGPTEWLKAGAPTDADFWTPPPIGTGVTDTTNNKYWKRTASATWKGTLLS